MQNWDRKGKHISTCIVKFHFSPSSVLLKKDGVINLTPHKAARVVIACCVLHNICVRQRVPNPEPAEKEEENVVAAADEDFRQDADVRRRCIAQWFWGFSWTSSLGYGLDIWIVSTWVHWANFLSQHVKLFFKPITACSPLWLEHILPQICTKCM